ncbi:hypothetical protein BCIN_09g01430 [Botrytis cinerea B05.10]|uniref:Transcription factor Zn, C2H2 n=3 Tax=Botryotinia fuckeliana TaxID=40559 RepID=A0A384JRR4_BOTFB|nr:hypothetical protein BCIN_09g01430 [Botrytis cinerea B05.10]ATZ53269.1 hypothetical protein BCIN_09g01430 [Botrytis cinerea B05.10]CCD55104.1 similar to transcription factor Zn, C2H2 [Botrytis cinerea T4]
MYSNSFNKNLRTRQYLDQGRLRPNPTAALSMGGFPMNRIRSDQSSTSTQSGSSGDLYSPILMNRDYSDQGSTSTQSRPSREFYSPAPSSPSMSFDLNASHLPQYYDGGYNQEYNNYTTASYSIERSSSNQSHSLKATPTSLGWSPETELLRLYKLIVPKGKEPYLELLPGYKIHQNTPQQVFLDPSSNPQKGVYPCQFPIGCPGKQFRRPADLERHYRNVHADADQKGSFPCDYKPCTRSKGPFTRKDHYRDHLKDFHKEDIGTAKQPKNTKDPEKLEALQQAWLEERQIDPRWWRCRKCLRRVYVDTNGYKCVTCNEECAQERIEAREQKKRGGDRDRIYRSDETMDMMYAAQCTSCNGSNWISDGGFGEEHSVPCPICVPSEEINYEDVEWREDARFKSEYENSY